jgi:hypothetical protein
VLIYVACSRANSFNTKFESREAITKQKKKFSFPRQKARMNRLARRRQGTPSVPSIADKTPPLSRKPAPVGALYKATSSPSPTHTKIPDAKLFAPKWHTYLAIGLLIIGGSGVIALVARISWRYFAKRRKAQMEANANNLIVNSNHNASNGIWDVAIVGAGPAGAACAHYLAKSNLRVLLLERDPFPRDKVCGDEVTPVAQEILNDLGVLPQLVNDNAVRWVRRFSSWLLLEFPALVTWMDKLYVFGIAMSFFFQRICR